MNKSHHGVLLDQDEMDRVHLGELVLGTIPGALSGPSYVLGGSSPPLSVSLYSLFIVDFFLLNWIPRVGACLIRPSLQLLGVLVVRTGKYGHVRHKAMNAIMTAFSLDTSLFSVVIFCYNIFPAPWYDIECHYQWQVVSFILSYIHADEDSPYGRGGVFPWARPLAQM